MSGVVANTPALGCGCSEAKAGVGGLWKPKLARTSLMRWQNGHCWEEARALSGLGFPKQRVRPGPQPSAKGRGRGGAVPFYKLRVTRICK